MNAENIENVPTVTEVTYAQSVFVGYWEYVLNQYAIPFGHYCVKLLYPIYIHFTLFNTTLFLIKFVPTGIYMYKFIKNIYLTSRERLKLKQLELEELQLQIQIVNTKLSVRDAEFAERGDLLRRKAENLRTVRARVRHTIAENEEIRNALNGNALWDENAYLNVNNTSDEGDNFMVELLKELKYDQVGMPELEPEMLSCGEHSREPSLETSVYSSVGDADGKQECCVKIVKVTNVYKVAYLRHFIKQRRLRRANKQELLRKKIDNIKKLLDDWQKTLNLVINSKISLLNNDSQLVEIASQEAMGDCSKPNFYNSSDSDSDFKHSVDNCHDEYSVSWSHKPFCGYNNYDDFNGEAFPREYYDIRDYEKYNCHEEQYECKGTGVLYVVPEETKSQLEIKEVQSNEE